MVTPNGSNFPRKYINLVFVFFNLHALLKNICRYAIPNVAVRLLLPMDTTPMRLPFCIVYIIIVMADSDIHPEKGMNYGSTNLYISC